MNRFIFFYSFRLLKSLLMSSSKVYRLFTPTRLGQFLDTLSQAQLREGAECRVRHFPRQGFSGKENVAIIKSSHKKYSSFSSMSFYSKVKPYVCNSKGLCQTSSRASCTCCPLHGLPCMMCFYIHVFLSSSPSSPAMPRDDHG